MKGVLVSAFAIAVAACGYVQAQGTSASVSGNNTAVVIRRANVASAGGYHLICVPVRPFDITGKKGDTLPLEDVLPAALYVGSQVTIGETMYEVKDGSWQVAGPVAEESDSPVLVKTKDVMWLHVPADEVTGGKASATMEGDPIVFCGQENVEMDGVNTEDGLHSMGNATSTEKTLGEVFNGAYGVGTQISRIENRGDKEYTVYYNFGGALGWQKLDPSQGMTSVDLSKIAIQPGEAFFYYAKPSVATPTN